MLLFAVECGHDAIGFDDIVVKRCKIMSEMLMDLSVLIKNGLRFLGDGFGGLRNGIRV